MKEIGCIDLLNELGVEDKEIHRIYLLFGESNDYLKNQVIGKIKHKVFEDEFESFDFSIFDGENMSVKEFENYLISRPFGSKKILLVQNGERLNKNDTKHILSLRIPDFSILVFVSNSKDTPLLMEEDAVIVKNYEVKQSMIENWIKVKFKEYDKDVSKDASKEIISRLDNNFYLLDTEITKVSLYIGNRKKAELKDVIEVVNYIPDSKIFEFINTILSNKKEKALQIYETMVNEHKIFQDNYLLSSLVKEFSRLLIIKDFKEHGIRDIQTISDSFKEIFKFEANKKALWNMIRNVDQYSFEELFDKYSKLVDLDVKSKNGELELPISLKLFIQTI